MRDFQAFVQIREIGAIGPDLPFVTAAAKSRIRSTMTNSCSSVNDKFPRMLYSSQSKRSREKHLSF